MRNVKPGMVFKYVKGKDLPEDMRFLVIEAYNCVVPPDSNCAVRTDCSQQHAKTVIIDSAWQTDLLNVQMRCIGRLDVYEEVISEDTEETVET